MLKRFFFFSEGFNGSKFSASWSSFLLPKQRTEMERECKNENLISNVFHLIFIDNTRYKAP